MEIHKSRNLINKLAFNLNNYYVYVIYYFYLIYIEKVNYVIVIIKKIDLWCFLMFKQFLFLTYFGTYICFTIFYIQYCKL